VSGVIDPLIAEVIDGDPRDLGYCYTGWTNALLRRHLAEVHGLTASRKSVSLALARLGIRWKRPRHQLALRPDTWRQSKGGSNAGSKVVPAPCC
jgi:transposase